MNYKIIKKDNKSYITLPYLEELGLKHCFTSIDMDLSMKANKSPESLESNFNSIYELLDIKGKLLYTGRQVHSNNLALIKDKTMGHEDRFGRYIEETDGLITGEESIVLMTRYADCTPIIIYDPINKVHANIHSGWKGVLKRIGIRGLRLMLKEYNSKIEDLVIALGPSISMEDFEVDKDVAELFRAEFDFHQDFMKKKNKIKEVIDLKGIIKRLYSMEGVRDDNIVDINLSTYSTPFLHSYRRDKENFGLMGAFTSLK